MRPIREWYKLAACKGLNESLFFIDKGQSALPAKKICKDCPVSLECADYAIINHEIGIWGGMTEKERKALPLEVLNLLRKEAITANIVENRASADYWIKHDRQQKLLVIEVFVEFELPPIQRFTFNK